MTIAFVRPKGSQLWHQVVGGIDLKIDRRLEAKTEYLDSGFAMVSSAVRSMHPSATYQESLSVPGQPGLTHKFLTADRRVIYACVTISVEGKEFITLSTALRPDPQPPQGRVTGRLRGSRTLRRAVRRRALRRPRA